MQIRTWQHAYAHAFPAERLAGLAADLDSRAKFWSGAVEGEWPRRHVVVVEAEGSVAGFADAGPALVDPPGSEQLGELYAIYVAPERWGRGVGRSLMAEVLGRLTQEGFREAILWVLEDNPRTRRFYELAGWHADGGRKDEEWLGTTAREVRYRISLEPAP